ncbi:hypothetical protein AMTR_s00070p00133020 [Amborella trichopoda]|uniref:Uncharacterized protein n=1 Tax=Amborella trichopoda TaxID=13333 RepID=U5DGL8_AMBTC|nr:hypothetical protein AMTR_s00070p00133020 [Amborella trichopoda]
MQCRKMKMPDMNVEEGDIPEMPTHSRASEKGKSPALIARRPTNKKKRVVANTLKLMVEAVAGLGSAFALLKNALNKSVTFVKKFSSLMVLKMMSLQRHAW